MQNEDIHIELIVRWLEGKASEDEKASLISWIETDPKHKAVYTKTVNMFYESQKKSISLDIKKSLSKVKQKAGVPQKKERKLVPFALSIAVSITILIAVGVYFFNQNTPPEIQPIAVQLHATDTILDAKLSDSSTISLASNSILTEVAFTDTARIVSLKGTGYFEIQPDTERPFIVQADQVEITVLGTHFAVVYDSVFHRTEVTVSEGKVRCLNLANNKSVILMDSMHCVFTSDTIGEVFHLKNLNILSWKTGVLEFENTPLSEAVSYMQTFFEKEIVFQDSVIKVCLFNATLKKTDFPEMLQMLRMIYGIKYAERDGIYYLSGTGCN